MGKSCGKFLQEILAGGGYAEWGDNMGGVANIFNYIRDSSCVL